MRVNKNKKEIADLLGRSYSTVRKWSEKRVKKELKNKCWIVIDIVKKGRDKFYSLEYKEQDFNVVNFVEEVFNVRDGDNFVCYSKVRLEGAEKDMPITRKQICEKTSTNERTASRYDDKLVEKEVIKKGGYYYIPYEENEEAIDAEEILVEDRELYKECREYFTRYIRGLALKEKCEECGAIEELHVHHNVSLSRVFNDLKREGLSPEEIKLRIIDEQLKNGFTTLCKGCHMKKHELYYKVNKYKLGDNLELINRIKGL